MNSPRTPFGRQKYSRALIFSFLTVLTLNLYLGWTAPLAQADPDDELLPTHPDFVIGKLENGLTYMIKEHATPPDWVAIRLLETSGSLNEDEDQRGLAHFFEHLAFNGSEHFEAGTLIPTFENMGVEFGANLNASTGFDRTLYLVNLPKNDPDTLRTGLLWASDVAFRIGLSDEEIEKERGVILEEYRGGLGPQQRLQKKLWARMMPGARLPERWPIGLEEVIMNADRAALQRYYDRWYRPDKMTLVIVGDVQAEEILPTINELFNMPSRDDGAMTPDYGAGITPYEKQMAAVVTDPEFVGCDVDLTYLDVPLAAATNRKTFRRQQVLGLAAFIFSHRFDAMISDGGMPFRAAQSDISPVFRSFTFAAAGVSCDPEQWQDALKILAAEVKRMHQYGAVASELDRAKQALLAQLEFFAAQENTLPSRALADIAASQVNAGDTLMSAAQAVEILKKTLPAISLAEINAVYQHYFDPAKMAFSLTLPEEAGLAIPTDDELAAAARAALMPEVTAYVEADGVESLLTELPMPGTIVSKSTDEELDITTVRFADNIVAHYKFHDYRKNNILITITLEGGSLEETARTRGLTDAAVAALNQSATSKLTSAQIRDLMIDKNISLDVSGQPRDSVQFVISGLPEDLEAGLQLAYLLLTDAIVEESAFENWHNAQLEALDGRRFNLNSEVIRQLGLARTDDPRFQLLSAENLNAITHDRVQDWLDHLMARAPIEISVVGDMEYEAVMPMLTRYLGSLNARPVVGSLAAKLRAVEVKVGPQHRVGSFVSQEDKAFGLVAFRGPNAVDTRRKRLLEVAASIMSTRLSKELREERGIVYSIGAMSAPAEVYPDLGIFYAASTCASKSADELVEVALEMYQEFADTGPSNAEVQTALAQITANLSKSIQEPGYWLSNLSHLDMRSQSLDQLRDPVAFFENEVSAEDIRTVFDEFFTPERIITVKVLPRADDNDSAGAKKN